MSLVHFLSISFLYFRLGDDESPIDREYGQEEDKRGGPRQLLDEKQETEERPGARSLECVFNYAIAYKAARAE